MPFGSGFKFGQRDRRRRVVPIRLVPPIPPSLKAQPHDIEIIVNALAPTIELLDHEVLIDVFGFTPVVIEALDKEYQITVNSAVAPVDIQAIDHEIDLTVATEYSPTINNQTHELILITQAKEVGSYPTIFIQHHELSFNTKG